jgi:hypothetical protein
MVTRNTNSKENIKHTTAQYGSTRLCFFFTLANRNGGCKTVASRRWQKQITMDFVVDFMKAVTLADIASY